MFSSGEAFETWFTKWRSAANPAKHLTDMRAANPILIPRNHRVEQAIRSGYDDDFAPFHRLVDALAAPYADQVEYADLETPPRPEENRPRNFLRHLGSLARSTRREVMPRSHGPQEYVALTCLPFFGPADA